MPGVAFFEKRGTQKYGGAGCAMLFKTAEQKSTIRRKIQRGVGEAQCLSAIARGEGPAEMAMALIR